MTPSSPLASHQSLASLKKITTLSRSATKNPVRKGSFGQSGFTPDHALLQPEIWDAFNATVQVLPMEAVTRHSARRHDLIVESIYARVGVKMELQFEAPVHLLIMYEEGTRREGQTSIDRLPLSTLRNFAKKLTFVPAGHAYHEWHETAALTKMSFLYITPTKIQKYEDADAVCAPRAFFEDPVLWETAVKLKNAIETTQLQSLIYLEALANVLTYELLRSGQRQVRNSILNRGGLAGWQKHVVTRYIEEHLDEQILLIELARLARLSQYHFCRAFKQTFGIPPHQYQLQRRIQRAKMLLADRRSSVTDVGLSLGYSQTNCFTVAFRKMTGRTPSQFRRDLT